MNFYIKRLIIWFGENDTPRVLNFKKDKVNVITGNSSTGKSNIISIIDYCLLSVRSNIVEPIVNEFTSWYGLEFSIDGKNYSIARKHPELDTATSEVFLQEKDFDVNVRPTSANMQIEAARKYLNSRIGFNNDLKYSQFRLNMVFNIITEDIITNPHFYLNYPFVEGNNYKNIDWPSIFENAITPNITELLTINKNINSLGNNIMNVERNNKKYEKAKEILNRCIDLLSLYNLVPLTLKNENLANQFSFLRDYINEIKLNLNCKNDELRNKLISLRSSLFKKSLQYSEVKNEVDQYKGYKNRLKEFGDSLLPIELLKREIKDDSKSIWTNYIIESLSLSLKRIKQQLAYNTLDDDKDTSLLTQLKKDCDDISQQIRSLEEIYKKKITDAESFRVVGTVEEIINENNSKPLIPQHYSLTLFISA